MATLVYKVNIFRQKEAMSCWYRVLETLIGTTPANAQIKQKFKDDQGISQHEVDSLILKPGVYDRQIGKVDPSTINQYRRRWTSDAVKEELLVPHGPVWITWEYNGFIHALLLIGVKGKYVYIQDPVKKLKPMAKNDPSMSETGSVMIDLATFNSANFAHNDGMSAWGNYMMYRKGHAFTVLETG